MKTHHRIPGIKTAIIAAFGLAAQSMARCPGDALQLNEISFLPATGQHQWVELTNRGNDPISANGMEIVSNGGSYSLPVQLQAIPKDGKVLIYFDGAGSAGNDYSFDTDKTAVLHTSEEAVDILGSPAGFCSLYRVTGVRSKETVLDFVAWGGEPGEAAADAAAKRIWPGNKTHLWTDPSNPPVGPGGWNVRQGDSIGRDGEGRWFYDQAGKDPAPDAVMPPELLSPPQGAKILDSPARCTFSSVHNAIRYETQISTDAEFTQLALSITTTDAIVGAKIDPPLQKNQRYSWRVRSVGGDNQPSAWSAPRTFTVGHPPLPGKSGKKLENTKADKFSLSGTVLDSRTGQGLADCSVQVGSNSDTTDAWGVYAISDLTPGSYTVNVSRVNYTFPVPGPSITIVDGSLAAPTISGTGDSRSLAVAPLGARKDTIMLAIAPGSTSSVMCNRDNSTNQAWDRALPRATHSGNDLESWWCWAVGATMINRYYGGTITRDEVVHAIKGDLLHDTDAGASAPDCKKALRHVLNTNDAQIEDLGRKPTSDEIKAWLDAGRPVYTSQPAHIMVIRAYRYENGELYAEHLNTNNDGNDNEWREWTGVTLHAGNLCWAPKSGLSGIQSDSRIASDSDGDGLCNFDEEVRFPFCSASQSDADSDGINDKVEIASYVFPRGAENGGNIAGFAPTDPDPDRDGLYPPADEDSDNGGIKDGDEDVNRDGVLAGEEGDIFDLNDDKSLDLVFCIDSTGSMGDDIAAVKANAIAILNKIETDFPNFRIAVVDYKDHPVDPYGDPGDYPFRDILSFSTNKSAIISAINSLGASGGNDWPESVYSAIIHCIQNPPGGWREDPVSRKIIYMGDAPPHIPEPFTGYSLGSVQAAASAGGVVWESGYARSTRTKGGTSLSGPVSSIGILVGSDSSARAAFEDIAQAMDGSLIRAAGAGNVPAAVVSALEAIRLNPIVKLEVAGGIGETNVIADASKTVDPQGCGIVRYDWDWEADGTFDEWSFAPKISKTYSGGFNGRLRVRATSVMGAEATGTFIILVPDFLDVTRYTDTTTVSSHLNRQTGGIVCDITLGNKTDAIKTLKEKFYFALPSTADLFLSNPDGTLDDGTPYVDITDIVEAALPGTGDGDMELDPGETVRLEDAIEIFSRDRSMPVGFVFAVWADPPPSAASAHYPTKLGHAKDRNDDFVVDDFEVLDAIDHWKDGQVSDFGLLEAIELWQAGGYAWDPARGAFVPKE